MHREVERCGKVKLTGAEFAQENESLRPEPTILRLKLHATAETRVARPVTDGLRDGERIERQQDGGAAYSSDAGEE